MLVNDVQQRIDDHYAGKQHMAYARIRATIEEMDRKREEKRKVCRNRILSEVLVGGNGGFCLYLCTIGFFNKN